MIICYLKKDGKSFFRVRADKLEEVSPGDLSFFERTLRKRLLIISRENLYYTSKIFPILSKRDLYQAVKSELETLSPYDHYQFFYLPQQLEGDKILVHLWSWDQTPVDDLVKEGFRYTHLLPEDLIYSSQGNTLYLISRENFLYIVTLKKGIFAGSSLISQNLEDLRIYLHTQRGFVPEEIVLYNPPEFLDDRTLYNLISDGIPVIRRKGDPFDDWPIFLERLNFRQFRVKPPIEVSIPDLTLVALRFALYLTIAGGVYYWSSVYSFHSEIKNLKIQTDSLDREIKVLTTEVASINGTETLQERLADLKEELSAKESARIHRITPILDRLSSLLPDGAYVRSVELRERKLSLGIVCQDAVEILERLRKVPEFKELKVPSPPIYDRTKNIYSLRVEITL